MEVPESLIAIYPQWRDDEYFVVRDDIVIVDHDRRIVAVVPLGSSSGPSQARVSGPMNLSQEEIRVLQITLNEKGFAVGEPDGRLGPRTNRALMEFQQRQGLQATGHIDERTVQALGINIRGQQGGSAEPSSSGRAGNTPQEPSSAQQPMPGGREPSTSGQSGRAMPQPQANPAANPNPSANPRSGGGTLPREQGR
jgi:peptidoglycan hydrolase-like protein with peptidoglycan-binding domain